MVCRMMTSLINGERAVVLLILTRIIYSAPFSLLLLEAYSLSLLAAISLFFEISLEGPPSKFCTRPGASSGTLLGAVTLPALMFSKLIQLSRGLATADVTLAEFQYQKMLYWTAYISCFSVLVFISVATQCLSNKRLLIKFCFTSIMFCALLYFLLPPGGASFGFRLAVPSFWMLGHGVTAVMLMHHILSCFPSCASLGEALLVTSGLITYSGDMVKSILVKMAQCSTSSDIVDVRYNIERSEISVIIQGYLLGLLLLPLLFKFFSQMVDRCTTSSSRFRSEVGRSVLFFTLLVISSTIVIPLLVQFVQDFQVHPLWW